MDVDFGGGHGTFVIAQAITESDVLAMESSPGLRAVLLARTFESREPGDRVAVLPGGLLEDLDAPEALEPLAKAPDSVSAVKLTVAQISAALKRARRRGDPTERATTIQAALRTEPLSQPEVITAA